MSALRMSVQSSTFKVQSRKRVETLNPEHSTLNRVSYVIESSTIVPQNFALARLADAIKLQKCLDGMRIGGVVVRPIGGNDRVLITDGFDRVLRDRLIRIDRDITVTAKIFAGRHF